MQPGFLPRVLGMLGLGSVSTPADDSGPSQTHQIGFPGNKATGRQPIDPIAALYQYGVHSNPHPGADALVLFINGDRTRPIVIATGDRRYRLTGLATGEIALADDLGQKVHLTRDGIKIVAGAGTAFSGDVSTDSNVAVGTGASGSFSTPSGAVVTVQDGIVTNIF